MNLYFLVEGETEKKVFPQWLFHLLPNLSKVNFAHDAVDNNYFLISGKGFPSIFDYFVDAVSEINAYQNYEKLILVLDADEVSIEEKIVEVKQFISDEKIVLNSKCELHIIVQKYCMETWFLGNCKVYPNNPHNNQDIVNFLSNYASFYNVSKQNPELMQKPDSFPKTTAIYHELYLRKMLATKNISYSKSNPKEVGEKYYLDELIKRINETPHLSSLKNFFSFCETLSL